MASADTDNKDDRRKKMKDSGEPYISKRNVPIPGKCAPEDIKVCSCKYQCAKISYEEKLKAFQNFYKLNYDDQSRLLAERMEIVNVKRRCKDETESPRDCSVRYYFPGANEETFQKLQVCRITVCYILKITARRLQKLQEKLKWNVPLEDKRGKRTSKSTVVQSVKFKKLKRTPIRMQPNLETSITVNTYKSFYTLLK